MTRSQITWALVLAVALCASAPVRAQLLPLRHYTTDGGARALPSVEVQQVYQDRLGYLWSVVYSSGLVRYDGVSMELYTEGDGLRSPAVWDAREDGAGHLWATSNEGLVVSEAPLAAYEPGERVRFTSQWQGVPLLDTSVRYNAMAADRDGRLWVAAGPLGIVRYRLRGGDLQADTLTPPPIPGIEEGSVRSVVARADGTVWAGLRDGPVVRFTPEGGAAVVRGTGGPWRAVATFHETAEGRLWGGELGGRIWTLDERAGPTFRTVSEMLSTTPNAIASDERGRIYVPSGASGVLVLEGGEGAPGRLWTRANGLLSDAVNDVLIDAEGNVWIAQSGGLSKLRHNADAFTGYSAESTVGERPVLPGPSVGAVLPTPGGPCVAWAGTSGGVACVRPASPSVYITEANGLANNYVNALARDRAGRVWAGTVGGITQIAPAGADGSGQAVRARGAVKVDGQRWAVRSFGGGSIYAAGTLALASGEGESVEAVWLAGARGLYLVVGDEWFWVAEGAGLPESILHAATVDDAGRLWVGTRDRGLFRTTRPVTLETLRTAAGPAAGGPGREVTGAFFVRAWSSASGAPTDQIEALLWDRGTLWTATPVGLFALRVRDGRLGVAARRGRERGFGSDHVFSLDRDPATGTLWVGTNGGLAAVDPSTAQVLRRVTRADGLIDNEVWYFGSVRVAGGAVYFGTAKGMSIYRPSLDRPSQTVPAVHLREASVTQGQGGRNQAVFAYAATSFADEESVRYQTRLVGYEPEWSAPSVEPRTRYTNLPAVFVSKGYEFEVRALAADGSWTSEPARYAFRVPPAWWARWWGFGLYALALAGGITVAVRANRARLLQRVRERTRIRESEHRAEQAASEQAAAEARARALQAENERAQVELEKAQELEVAFRELKEAQARLVQSEKLASLGRLTAGIAHEIKNPLNFVTNFASLTRDLTRDAEAETDEGERRALLVDIRQNVEKIETHGRRADAIVRSMMDHARGVGGPQHALDLNALVQDAATLAWHGLLARRPDAALAFDVNVGDAVGEVVATPDDLRRVIINLLDNAFDAVRDRAEAEGEGFEPAVTVTTRRQGDTVDIRVTDNGPGISADRQARVFEPFYTTKPAGEGTGLGLSLSYDIVTLGHGGTLAVTSEPPGATFVLTLPAARPDAAPA